MKRTLVLIAMILGICGISSLNAQRTYSLKSPDAKIEVTVNIDETVSYSVMHNGTQIIADSPISMELNDGKVLGVRGKVKNVKNKTVDEIISADFYKKAQVRNNYNELIVNFKENYKLTFRVFDDGVAYRFSTSFKNQIIVKKENVNYCFDDDYTAYIPYVNARKGEGDFLTQQFFTSFESQYTVDSISKMDVERIAFTPLLICLKDGKKAVIVESDLEDYPGTFFRKGKGNSLEGVQSTYPKVEEQGGHNMLQMVVKERENYVAKVAGSRDFPWRAMVISENDAELMNSDMVYKLASPSRVKDVSWIKPGKVAWDWWNNWNIWGVDFKAGVNNDTYKYYIDFASANGIEYVILDEGWAVNKQADLFMVVPEINLEELVAYAKERNVGLVLWAGYYAIDRDMENVCKYYSEMGIKGFKVDFMDRDDQKVVDFYYRMAAMAAKYHLFIDFHGAYKPTGLSRTYPNVLNFEGVYGLEQSKWDDDLNQVNYECMIPYIRMVAGNLDYTQGAMDNATKYHFRAIYTNPMSQGTRCRQLAEYVIFESPFNMLCDSPTKYMQDQECVDYIAGIPTVWDETVALDGKLGEYAVIARRSGDTWYVGAITNWDARTIEIDLDKIGVKTDNIKAFVDGVNANRYAEDYKVITNSSELRGNRDDEDFRDNKISIELKSGGGAVIIIRN
jgi:alpha-glucosidase